MGRIKQLMVKKASRELVNTEGNQFTSDFTNNKRLLNRSMPSKKVRNKIAGYIARLDRARHTEKKKKKASEESQEENL